MTTSRLPRLLISLTVMALALSCAKKREVEDRAAAPAAAAAPTPKPAESAVQTAQPTPTPAPPAAPAVAQRQAATLADAPAGDWDPQAAYRDSVPSAAPPADRAPGGTASGTLTKDVAPELAGKAAATRRAPPSPPAKSAAMPKDDAEDSAKAKVNEAPSPARAEAGEKRAAHADASLELDSALPDRRDSGAGKKGLATGRGASVTGGYPVGPSAGAGLALARNDMPASRLVVARHPPPFRIVPRPAPVYHSDRAFRPLPSPPAFWPKDGRYRSTYLPGRGDLDHLGAFLRRTATGTDAALAEAPRLTEPTLPAPAGRSLDVVVDQDRGMLAPEGGVTTLRVRLRATDAAPGPRPPVHLHLVLDSSGSMRGASWQSVCAAVREVARVLQPQDLLSVSHYGSQAEVLSPPVSGATPAVQQVAERVCRLRVRGETNIFEGLRAGYQQARSVYDPRAVNRVLLVSDGMATVGPRDLYSLTTQTSQALGEGITTSALGVGADFDALLMGRVALEGGGNDHYVRDAAAVAAVLADELDVLARQAAEVVDLRVLLPDDVDLLEVIGSEALGEAERERAREVEVRTDQRLARDQGIATDRQRDHTGGVRMLLPSFRLGDEHAILLVVRTPPGQGTRTLAEVELRYKDVLHKRNVRLHGVREVQYADSQRAADAAQMDEVTVAEAKARAAMALQRASEYLDPANLPRIRMELTQAASRVRAAADRTGQAELHAQASQLRALADATGAPLAGRQPYLAAALHYQWRLCGGATLWRR